MTIVCVSFVLLCFVALYVATEMDVLCKESVSRSELVSKLSRWSVEKLQQVRGSIFQEAKDKQLAAAGDVMVNRQKRANGKPLW